MNRSRRLAKRRDRRKAKESGYRREGKANMGGRVGHGTSGSPGGPRQVGFYLVPEQKRPLELPKSKPEHALRVTLAELAKRR